MDTILECFGPSDNVREIASELKSRGLRRLTKRP